MNRVAAMTPAEREDLMRIAAHQNNMPPAVIEKDFWVCWVLGKLFEHKELGRLILFKGGTSLSKVFGLIERFSEDIDLVLDWRQITSENPADERSATGQRTFNETLLSDTHDYLRRTFMPAVVDAVGAQCEVTIEENSEVITVRYPNAFPPEYLRPEIQLEIGPLGSWTPNSSYSIMPYAAEVLPDVFKESTCDVKAIMAERTFWEKVTILHAEAYRPEGSAPPVRYSRHYYDLYRMSESPVTDSALEDMALLAEVVAFKQKFYRLNRARYDLAIPGSIRLAPSEHNRSILQEDYGQMRNMIFGDYPDFEQIVAGLTALEKRINQR